LAGIDRTYVSGIERGIRNPTVTVLQSLAEALKIDMAVLLEQPEIPTPPRKHPPLKT
jgi:transcriptional regulator with XRE-family HTH domain